MRASLRAPVLPGILLVLALAGLPGCFAFEEIDSGMEEMNWTVKEEPEPKRVPRAAASGKSDDSAPRRSLWEGGRSLNPNEMDAEIARCALGGSVQFMTRSDCLARGGRPG